jgi:hypothetical protein
MSNASVQTQDGLEAQSLLPVRRLHNFIYCARLFRLSKIFHAQPASFDDAFERADGNGCRSRREEVHFETRAVKCDAGQSLVTSAATVQTGEGSNHNSNASIALRTASSSVSPAEAQPGSSGKTADQRFVSGSCSTTKRSFMSNILVQPHFSSKPAERFMS